MSVALIDGDEAIFKAAVIKTDDVDFDTGATTERPPTFAEARDRLDALIEQWTHEAGCDDHVVVLSPDDRRLFRRGLFADYKAGRSEKPEHFWFLVEHLRSKHPVESICGLEADDVMGLLSGEDRVIVSSDKDMKTVPGTLYNPGKGKKGVISKNRADWQWMLQTLTGDPTDGFAGCIGVGAAKAEALLAQAASISGWWPLVVAAFEAPKSKRYAHSPQTRHDALLQAQLARILRPGEYHDGHIRYRIGNHQINLNVAQLAR